MSFLFTQNLNPILKIEGGLHKVYGVFCQALTRNFLTTIATNAHQKALPLPIGVRARFFRIQAGRNGNHNHMRDMLWIMLEEATELKLK